MHILAFMAVVATITYLVFGGYILLLDIRSRLHRLFFYMTFALAFWAFCAFWVYEAPSAETVRQWVKISFPAPVLFYAFAFHFSIVLFRSDRQASWLYCLIYIPAVYFTLLNFTSYTMYSGFIRYGSIWTFEIANDFARGRSFILYYVGYLVACLVLFLIRRRRVESYREKMQSMVLFCSLIITLTIASLEGVILPEFTSYRSPQPAPIFLMIWMGGILFSMVRYRFLTISHAMVGEDLADNISNAIVLLDNEARIITINKKGLALADGPKEAFIHAPLSSLLEEHEKIIGEIDGMRRGEFRSFACRVHVKNGKSASTLLDARFSMVKDHFGDPIGVMLIGREVKESRQFKSRYKITDREEEIVQHIISGQPTKKIASDLNVAERTVKAHITNIYNKLGVGNRMQLLNLIKEYDLFPEHSAEKTLIFTRNLT
ncbi:MAG: PAS domain-containing protein [Spirochaetes bacterium]|nr:PAS domain-containing protein [Spirochaetota bacterium]